MNTLKAHYHQQLNEAFLTEMLGDREDIKQFVRELTDVFEEYNEAVAGLDNDYLIEAADVAALKPRQITNLFKGAERVSKGLPAKAGLLGGAKEKMAAAKELASKLIAAVKQGAEKLQQTEPVQNFDAKVDETLNKWKETLGPTHKAVEMGEKLGEIGKNHPKKTAFVIGVLTALTTAVGSPAFGLAAGMAMRTAVGLAKGEKASAALGKAAFTAAVGATIGAIGKEAFEHFGLIPDDAGNVELATSPEEIKGVEAPAELSEYQKWVQEWGNDLLKKDFTDSKLGQLLQQKIESGEDTPRGIASRLEWYVKQAYGEDPRGGLFSTASPKQLTSQAIGSMMKELDVESYKGNTAELLTKLFGEGGEGAAEAGAEAGEMGYGELSDKLDNPKNVEKIAKAIADKVDDNTDWKTAMDSVLHDQMDFKGTGSDLDRAQEHLRSAVEDYMQDKGGMDDEAFANLKGAEGAGAELADPSTLKSSQDLTDWGKKLTDNPEQMQKIIDGIGGDISASSVYQHLTKEMGVDLQEIYGGGNRGKRSGGQFARWLAVKLKNKMAGDAAEEDF